MRQRAAAAAAAPQEQRNYAPVPPSLPLLALAALRRCCRCVYRPRQEDCSEKSSSSLRHTMRCWSSKQSPGLRRATSPMLSSGTPCRRNQTSATGTTIVSSSAVPPTTPTSTQRVLYFHPASCGGRAGRWEAEAVDLLERFRADEKQTDVPQEGMMQLHAGSSLNCGWGSISWHLLQQAVPEMPPSCRAATGKEPTAGSFGRCCHATTGALLPLVGRLSQTCLIGVVKR